MIQTTKRVCVVTILIASIVFSLANITGCYRPTQGAKSTSVLDTIKTSGVVKVGYCGYPPYVTKDPASGSVTGFSVELIELIFKNWGGEVKIEWIETTWDRMKLDVNSERIHLLADPVWRTISRAKEVGFSNSYASFAYGVGVVRKGDKRFGVPLDMNQAGVVISVAQAGGSHEYVKVNCPLATIKTLPNSSLDVALQDVLAGHCDIALGDLATVKRFLSTHESVVDGRFVESPPVIVPAGVLLPQGDFKFTEFVNVSIEYLESTGQLKRLAEKYHIEDLRVK